jgi:anaerobic selenocysteine-containing dehydrogenase
VQVIAAVARRVLGDACPVNFAEMEEHANIRAFIARTIPGYGAIGEIDRTKREFHIEGRIFHEPRFKTDTGRAKFHAVTPPPLAAVDGNSLRLMTIRSEGQFNTVVYEEEDLYRGQERRDVILMSRADMDRLGLKVDDKVTVRSAIGAMRGVLVRAFDIRAGNAAMYYPEANAIVPRRIDQASRTPSFKNVAITVERETRLNVLK